MGNRTYVEKSKDIMGYKAMGRKLIENGDSFVLRETQSSYESILNAADVRLSEDNTFRWQIDLKTL